MKKIIALGILCIFCGAAFVFADDASVLPARIGRVYLAPVFAFANGEYDEDGGYSGYKSGEGSMKAFALGVAAEYGVIDWISAAVQWTPAWVLASDVDVRQEIPVGTYTGTIMDKVNANGPADIFVGGKFLLAGEKAPIQSSKIRFALATGVKIPLPGPDFEEQYKNAGTGKAAAAANQDKHVLGIGIRAYADYVFNKNFFLNFYTEFIGYPVNGKLSESGLPGYIQKTGLDQLQSKVVEGTGRYDLVSYKDEVFYGYDLNMEVEPVFSASLPKGINFSTGLPLNFHYSPPSEYNAFIDPTVLSYMPAAADLVPEGKPSKLLSLRPSVSFFFTGFLLPTEFKLGYWLPLWGENSMATHSVVLQIKLYFRI
ncbi:MAG: hypothetical protein LBF63_01895 [Treponema sp.]|jgi:hypothetical protein|nr:hypothetical protein [Treponema sp.]